MSILQSVISVCDIHVEKIKIAQKEVKPFFPMRPEILEDLSNDTMAYIEVLVSRFGKLQDLMGNKLFKELLDQKQQTTGVTLIDKIHQLQQMNIAIDEATWMHLREIRNHATHEYPEDLNQMAKHLNALYSHIPTLLTIYQDILAAL